MASTIRVFRDSLTIDRNQISSVGARPGDTIVFAARQVVLSALTPAYDYIIAADQLTVPPNASTSIIGVRGNPSPDVTVMAANIQGLLQVTCAGMPGEDGLDGEDGESGIERPDGGRPTLLPGGNGGNGGNGGDAGAGGVIKVHYASATQTPTGTAPGASGGRAGRAGAGGPGRPPGRPGRPGRPGKDAGPGTVEIRQVAAADVWKALDAASTQGWAAYRAEVAGFFFRKFDFGSQLTALNETGAALLLNPSDPEAATIRSRIMNRQIPSGLARDLDIAPDYPGLASDLVAEIAVVQQAFQFFVSTAELEANADAILTHLGAIKIQLIHRRQEAQADILVAKQDVDIAKAEKANIQVQIDQVKKEIEAVRERKFGFGSMISDVASIAGVVVGIGTGVGALISIPAGLAALDRVAEGKDLGILLGALNNPPNDPKHPTSSEYDIAKAKGLGGGLEDLVKGTSSMISFVKVVSDLEHAMSRSGQGETGRLLKQQAMLVGQQMVASLREKQGHTRVAAAELRANNLTADIADINFREEHWKEEKKKLAEVIDLLIRAARRLVDIVMEDVFLAQRAREIYQLDDTPGLRFDFGFLHPDQDHSLTPRDRAIESLKSLTGFAIQVLSWNKIFQHLNTAQIGFDVIHPRLSLTISNPAQLRAFASGAGLTFSIPMADVPSGMFELKANAVSLEMTGASSVQSANIWITHSGVWSMNRRTDGSITEMSLRPRSEVFAVGPATGKLTASIPAHPQSGSETGPPFSFWGRGVVTTFKLQITSPSAMNLAQLSSIHITVDCIAFARHGAGALPTITTIRPAVRLTAALPLNASGSGTPVTV